LTGKWKHFKKIVLPGDVISFQIVRWAAHVAGQSGKEKLFIYSSQIGNLKSAV